MAIIACALLIAAMCCTSVASAADDEAETPQLARILEKMNLSLSGKNKKITATAKHEFSLFAGTIKVTVELYKSTTYKTDYTDMTLVGKTFSPNLSKGNSLSYTASTNEESGYWQARMLFKIGNGEWQSNTSKVCHYDVNGNLLED